MKILITGGAGFIGSHLAAYHLQKNDEVYAIDNLLGGSLNNIQSLKTHPNFHFYNEDLLSFPDIKNILTMVDRIYHLAALLGMFNVIEKPVATLKINIGTLETILQSCCNLEKKPTILVASSSEVYGQQSGLLKEDSHLVLETSLKTHSSYPISKMCNESMAFSYYKEFNLPCIILRIFNTIGPNQSPQYGMVVPRFIQQVLRNEPITVFGNGNQCRSFCDVRDLVNLLDLIGSNKSCVGQVFNVGKAELVTINELANLVKTIAGSQSPIHHVPFEEVYHNQQLGIRERRMNDEKLLAHTNNYNYKWSLQDTIKDLVRQGKNANKQVAN